MVRLKFLVFALLVLGLGLAHLSLLSEPLRARAIEGASAQAVSGAADVARRVDARRAEVQAATLKLAASTDVAAAVHALQSQPAPRNPKDKNKDVEPPALLPLTAERFGTVRTAVEAALPKELEGTVVALLVEGAAFHARKGGEPSSDASALDVPALVSAGSTVVEAFGAAHAFAAVPLLWGGEPGAKPTVSLVVGAPVVSDATLQAAVDASGVSALALVQAGKVVGAAGPQKDQAEGAVAKLAVGTRDTVLSTGHLQALGPVMLPVLTSGDAMGGKAPLMVGARSALTGTPYEVVALASTQSLLGTLAAYQQNALFGLAGLLGFSLLWTLLMGGGRRSGDEAQGSSDTLGLSAAMAAAPQAPAPVAQAPVGEPAPQHHSQPPAPAFTAAAAVHAPQQAPFAAAPPPAADPFAGEAFPFPAPPAADPFGAPPPAADPFGAADPFTAAPPPAADPFAGADAFPFPAPPVPAAQPQYAAPAMPFEPDPASLPPSDGIATASPRRGAFAFEDQPTAAYSLQQAADPFALAAAQATPEPESSPETTRVAAIPRELLQASVRPPTSEAIPLPPARGAPMQQAAIPLPGLSPAGSAAAVALSEEQHFQEVFREFVTTRERCGEPADGLTYDKFQQKLRKNKEQLVQKYACKTVRFQVYVKEGKAALKATPVKD